MLIINVHAPVLKNYFATLMFLFLHRASYTAAEALTMIMGNNIDIPNGSEDENLSDNNSDPEFRAPSSDSVDDSEDSESDGDDGTPDNRNLLVADASAR